MLVDYVGERDAGMAETGASASASASEDEGVGAVAVSAARQTCRVGQLGC